MKDLDILLVDKNSGRVRSLHCSRRRKFFLLGLTLVTGVLFFGALAGYSKARLSLSFYDSTLARLAKEKDAFKLLSAAQANRIQSLEEEKQKVLSYNKEIEGRIGQINSIMSVIKAHELVPSGPADNSGVGGAERDCPEEHETAHECDEPRASLGSFEKLLVGWAQDDSSAAVNSGLIETIDGLIQILRVLPIASPGATEVSSDFGHRRSPFSGRIKMHEGIDFSLPYGAPVYASGDGVVKQVSRNGTYGLMIDIEHSPRVVTRYAHLSKARVKQGQQVQRGTRIADVGASGKVTGPHLHYEVIVDGRARNPQRFLEIAQKLQNLFS
jgi:murein DD-endopeptidase MepM/ murein hydrolase activator NlpD